MKKWIVIIYIAAATILFGYAKADDKQTKNKEIVIAGALADSNSTVQIEALNARYVKNFVEINWNTTIEAGNKQFEIQRSADGDDFKTIGIVFTLEDSQALKNYRFKDDLKGITNERKISYRIKQVNINEQYSFSNIVLAEATRS